MNDQGALIYARNCTTLEDLEPHEEWALDRFYLLPGAEVTLVDEVSKHSALDICLGANFPVELEEQFEEYEEGGSTHLRPTGRVIVRYRGIYDADTPALLGFSEQHLKKLFLTRLQVRRLQISWFTFSSWRSVNTALLKTVDKLEYFLNASTSTTCSKSDHEPFTQERGAVKMAVGVEVSLHNGSVRQGLGRNYIEALINSGV